MRAPCSVNAFGERIFDGFLCFSLLTGKLEGEIVWKLVAIPAEFLVETLRRNALNSALIRAQPIRGKLF